MSTVGQWLWKVALRKGITRFVQTFLVTYGSTLSGLGISVQQDVLVASLVGGSEILRNWLKVKKGFTWL